MKRSLIVALTPQRVIGVAGGLPWRLSADLQRFKRLTMGHHLIMGRKTFDSIGRPLPGRTSIVVSRQPERISNLPQEVLQSSSLEQAFKLAQHDTEAFVIGGGEMYCLALPLVDRLYVTWVEADLPGDTYFPAISNEEWQLQEAALIPGDEKNEFGTRFCVYERAHIE